MVLDTNILIAYVHGEEKVINALTQWKIFGSQLLISSISRAEVLAQPQLSEFEIIKITSFLEENFISIPFDDRLADTAAMLRRSYLVKLPDAGIAATAINHRKPLVTRNVRDFKKIPKLEIIEL